MICRGSVCLSKVCTLCFVEKPGAKVLTHYDAHQVLYDRVPFCPVLIIFICFLLFFSLLGAQDYSGALAAFESAARINPMLMPRLRDNMAVCHAAENVMLL